MHSAPRPAAAFALLCAAVCAVVVAYSQNSILDWDEGFHLVAASLIRAGRQPYVDFCFPQPPLHAWWNALLLGLSGGGWRGPQFIAALETCGAILLAAQYAYRRSPLAGYATALLFGLNSIVLAFGTKAQAYGACLLLMVAAFRATIATRPTLGGVLAGAAASCSLLSAPAAPVLVLWHAFEKRWRDALFCCIGVLAGLLPIIASVLRTPALAWFNLVEYHLTYRRAGWEDTTEFDLEVLTSWIYSWQAWLLLTFAAFGLWRMRRQRTELMLAIALAIALGIEAATAHPTFKQYFVLALPFVSIVAGIGFAKAASRAALIPLTGILVVALANSLVHIREDNFTWTTMDALAREIEEVTDNQGQVLADPPVYFALRRFPPSGMEFPASHDIEFPPDRAAALHIVPWSALKRRIHAGEFAAVQTCKGDEDEIIALELPKRYTQSTTIDGCQVYWDLR